ncbi:protein of unknown function (plasmid) [Caballeronia sp. S22]
MTRITGLQWQTYSGARTFTNTTIVSLIGRVAEGSALASGTFDGGFKHCRLYECCPKFRARTIGGIK